MISYLATLAVALMAFTASAQYAYQTYQDPECSVNPALSSGQIEICECVNFLTTGPQASEDAAAIKIIFYGGDAGYSCTLYNNQNCYSTYNFQPAPVTPGCNPLPGLGAVSSMMCGCTNT